MALQQWVAFVEVCRTGSIGAAAQGLGYTQSAVSRQLAALEHDVGVRLLNRRARGVTPTEAGDAFLHHARVVVNEARRARAAAARSPGDVERLAIGAVPSAAASVVPRALRRLTDAGHRLQWSLVPGLTGELTGMLGQGEIDVAVVTDAPPGLRRDAQHETVRICGDSWFVVVPADHRLAHRRAVAFGELAEDVWVEDNSGSEAILRRLATTTGASLTIDMTATDLLTKTGLVAAGHGVALVPGLLVDSLRPDLRALGITPAAKRGVYLVHRAAEHGRYERLVESLRRSAAGPQPNS